MKKPEPARAIERALSQRLLASYRRAFSSPPRRIVVGFSGGPDSLALAILLAGIERAVASDVVLLHVDHRMRTGSSEDADRCVALAKELGLPIVVRRLRGHPQTLFPGVGPEEAARRGRYQAFVDVADDGDVVALAHQASDQAETVLLHLMRGAGIRGLAGMSALGTIGVPWWNSDVERRELRVWRPLLAESRADLARVVEHNNLTPVLDESNASDAYRRNAIRHRVLPAMRSVEPAIDWRLGDLAMIAAGEDDFLHAVAEEALGACLAPEGLIRRELRRLHPAIARRVVRLFVERTTGLDLTFDRVEAIRGLAESGRQSARLELGEGLLAGLFRDFLRCGRESDLRRAAWQDSGLLLPPADDRKRICVEGDTVVVESDARVDPVAITRRVHTPGAVAVRPVSEEADPAARRRWAEWLRSRSVSPWIRDDVLGVAIGGELVWIPHRDDLDLPYNSSGDRVITLIRTVEEEGG